MPLPQLYVGLLGFRPESEALLRKFLTEHNRRARADQDDTRGSQVLWVITGHRDADALLICGEGARSALGGIVRFGSHSASSEAATSVVIDQITQPFAISDPHHLAALGVDMKTYPIFNLSVPTTLAVTLHQFESMLRPLRSLYALATNLNAHRKQLDTSFTYHLETQGRLEALIDLPQRRILIRPGAKPYDIGTAAWHKRPRVANFAPAHFLHCTLSEIIWLYAVHCPRFDLPDRYRAKPFWLRRTPKVRSSLLYARHADLIVRICSAPARLHELASELAIDASWIERLVYALYLIRSISTSAQADASISPPAAPNEGLDSGTWMIDQLGKSHQTVADNLEWPLRLVERSTLGRR